MGAQATESAPPVDGSSKAQKRDDLPNPLGDAQRKLRKDAVAKLIKGEASLQTRNGAQVIAVPTESGEDRYVQMYTTEREESIFTILSEFGTQKLGQGVRGTDGPLHNQIAQPDRTWDGNATDDNSTYWTEDFNRAHFQDMMFGEGESFKDFYLKQSNGRFLATGDVSDWVKVPYNAARYGTNKLSDAETVWPFVEDTAQAWYNSQVAAGKTAAEIKTYLAQFDKVDRYDYDKDGNFLEADGYIDHFQAIHAGEGEEAGGGAQGEDAIWSHRWYVNSTDIGTTGPAFNKLGGAPLGDTGMWIGDYTTEPENGGLGVFAHEFGHDLGLPDLYDTAGGDNGTGFWTLMSGGSWLNRGADSIGTTPGYMGAWEKLQLGWLDHQVIQHGTDTNLQVGAADVAGKQAAVVSLPDKSVTTQYNTPHSGSNEWWSGSADNINTTLTREISVPADARRAFVKAFLQYDIEAGYDYLYAEVSTNGTDWTKLATLDGVSAWSEQSFNVSAYAGQTVQFRFRYQTDGGVSQPGAFIDDISLVSGRTVVWTDDVEGADQWTADGFTKIDGSASKTASQYYLFENRVYGGYDETLKTGPYNFGWASTKPDWVERFPYQNGLLAWYADGTYADNNTSVHPGGGQVLPVDARPTPIVFADGVKLGNRRQPFDATFGLEATDAVTFHRNGVATNVPSSPAIPTFDDSNPEAYWSSANPMSSTKVAGSGTVVTVTGATGDTLDLSVSFK
ncbi:immune inhibitor A [Knoellia locipacati]